MKNISSETIILEINDIKVATQDHQSLVVAFKGIKDQVRLLNLALCVKNHSTFKAVIDSIDNEELRFDIARIVGPMDSFKYCVSKIADEKLIEKLYYDFTNREKRFLEIIVKKREFLITKITSEKILTDIIKECGMMLLTFDQ